MNETFKFPFYAKLAFVLLSLISLFVILYYGQGILVPILMAMLFAILLRPVAGFFKTKLHFPNVIAAMFSVLLFVLLIVGIFTFISWQVTDIANDWDTIKSNFQIHLSHLQEIVRDNFNLSKREQTKFINDATKDSMQTGKDLVGNTLLSFTDVLLNLMLIPIYTFLFLLYRTHFMKFLSKLFRKEHHPAMQDILGQIKISVQSYIIGLMVEMVAVSVLTSIGFMIIGLKYAILLGVITGILNLIPYIGILFAGILSIIASLTTTPELSIIVGVIVVNLIVQLIDNNLLVPMIVSSKVQINAFVSIVGIIIGGAIAGVSGMFLAIPVIAILKVIFDRVESLRPWGYLMGDDLPKTYEWHRIKLPLYDYDAGTDADTIVITEAQPPVFTETTTDTKKTE